MTTGYTPCMVILSLALPTLLRARLGQARTTPASHTVHGLYATKMTVILWLSME